LHATTQGYTRIIPVQNKLRRGSILF